MQMNAELLSVQVLVTIILDFRAKIATPMVKLGSDCNCFRVMLSHKTKASAHSARVDFEAFCIQWCLPCRFAKESIR
jgi:hypothetical protein